MDNTRKPALIGFVGQSSTVDDNDNEVEVKTPWWKDPEGCAWRKNWKRFILISILVIMWIFFTGLMTIYGSNEKKRKMLMICVSSNEPKSIWIAGQVEDEMLINVNGPFLEEFSPPDPDKKSIFISVEKVKMNSVIKDSAYITPLVINSTKEISESTWKVDLLKFVDSGSVRNYTKRMMISEPNAGSEDWIRILVTTDRNETTSLDLAYNLSPIREYVGIGCALAVLIGLYILIGFELVHRALAAVLGSTMALAIMAFLGERPNLEEVVSWIDISTITLLFAMMVIVAVLTKTGVFDYLSVVAFQLTRGRLWPLIITLCVFSGVVSAIIDVVTTVLLMTPVTIRLCEVLKLNPKPVLLAIIFSCNILCSLTPVGDPPNLIIFNNEDVSKAGVDFTTFMVHMGLGVWLSTLVLFLLLRYCFYRRVSTLQFDEPTEIRHELNVWQRTASSMSMYTRDEMELRRVLSQHVRKLEKQIDGRRDSTLSNMTIRSNVITQHDNPDTSKDDYHALLKELKAKYPIKDMVLLIKCGVAFAFAILFFFLHSFEGVHLNTAWSALLAAVLLLILADTEDLDAVLARIEWATLLFFAALFVLMECLTKLGLIDYVGKLTQIVVLSVDKVYQLPIGILLILWVSAIASAIVDNVPLATMMLKIVVSLSKNPDLLLPLQPLVWALAFGCSFGGNGTLIGSSANVVCTGVAEQHGYKITMWEFSKIGFPVTIVTVLVISAYLMIAHVAFQWH